RPSKRDSRPPSVGVAARADFFFPVPGAAERSLRSEEHTSELQSLAYLVCRLLLEKKNREALKECPKVELCIVADGEGESERIVGLREVTARLPKTPISDESVGTAMLYSSGTTGRPKGILRPLPEQPPTQQLPIFDFLHKL